MSTHKRVQRFKGGFVFGRHPTLASRNSYPIPRYIPDFYSMGAVKLRLRPLIFCHLQVLLASPRDHSPCLVIHPILTITPYLPLDQTLPLPSGTPIILLPYGTPAYFRTTYEGPTSSLVAQFKTALHGLGVSDWENTWHDDGSSRQGGDVRRPMFIIAQLTIENKQGVDKGLLVIYPTALCLSFSPSTSSLCQPSAHMLDLPTPLQPSPQVPPAIPTQDKPYGIYSSTSDSLQRIRLFTLSSHRDIHRVADEVGSYIEAVAREREKERERLKREREEGASSSPSLSRVVAPTPITRSSTSSVDALDQLPLQSAPSFQSSFYPSPPLANTNAMDAQTSPGADDSPHLGDANDTLGADNIPVEPVSEDPFDNIESSWAQSSQEYMGMDLDFDIGMSLGIAQGSNERDVYVDVRHSMDFEDAFTDDDFSFFDQPSRSVPPAFVAPTATPAVIPDPPSDVFLKGMSKAERTVIKAEEHSTPFEHHTADALPWTHADTLFSPIHLDTELPELSPPSGQTPEADSSPTTPDVQLDPSVVIRDTTGTSTSLLASPFDPIPFASHHRTSDGKYLHGKFALSSPKRQDFSGSRADSGLLDPSSPTQEEGWKAQYDAITDPRIGVVLKLKKKREPSQTTNNELCSPSWMQEEEHVMVLPDEDASSEEESDGVDPGFSPPGTPPPPHLPLGPTLLCTHFEHALLLTIGVSLRSSDSANTTLSNPVIPISVPTPVSPAATLGALAERLRSLEAVVNAVASEMVENSVWAEAWRSIIPSSQLSQSDVWPSEIKYASQLLTLVSESGAISNLSSLFDICECPQALHFVGIPKRLTAASLKPLESPHIAIGKGENVIHALPTALRFWEKLGLCPRGGKKEVSVFVLYDKEGDGNQRELQIDSWLESIKASYTVRRTPSYGNLNLGRCHHGHHGSKDGHFPIRYDTSLRKSIASIFSNLAPAEYHYIFLFLIPNSIMTFTSPVLRQAIAAMKKGLKDHAEINAIYELVPEHLVFGPLHSPSEHELFITNICSSIYNKTPSIVSRFTSRNLLGSYTIRGRIEEPDFTLARPLPYKVSFTREAQASLDVADQCTLVHVGYQMSACGKWLVAACIDQRGEAHDVGVWLTRTSSDVDEVEVSDEAYIVGKIWEFTQSFTKTADLRWRIVITKYGAMGEDELDAWIHHLENEMDRFSRPLWHASILCTEVNAPWCIPNIRRDSSNPHPPSSNSATLTKDSIFIDISSQTYMLCSQKRFPLSLPINTSFRHSVIAESSSDALTESELVSSEKTEEKVRIPHPVTLLPRSSTKLIRIPSSSATISMLDIHLLYITPSHPDLPDESKFNQEITRNFYELSLLAALRWKLNANPILPFHLGAVEVMRLALERDGELLEAVLDG
ncbi:hypothetical protein M378DRAFT_185773 [Amanita muscaria Koide BX008]|uniref:Mediator of RNA polymerase II transcription subunit 13 n=1 Tax=Amanita muscaria (strain Koide BX008) TaxID=946122 RepID=A0A0C2XF06_AMAMK|nr:hypothetical protein M378DRAFT_185773 [Amanita muscaria Koide BX008]